MRDSRRDPASEAVIALRKAMGMTQQKFAVKAMECAVTTVGRWESFLPPHGETLLTLARVARKYKHNRISDRFLVLYLDEAIQAVIACGGSNIAGGLQIERP